MILLQALGLLTLGACGRSGADIGPPVPAGDAIASARQAGAIEGSVQVVFTWRLNEAGSRLQGRGAARIQSPGIQSPDRARLDLFTDNGETAARVALVESELRLPDEVDLRLVPPPPLLWASLGVFHPGADAEVLGAERWDGTGVRLRYRLSDGTELHYGLRSGQIEAVELLRDGRVVEWVRLEGRRDGIPERSVYRSLPDFRELSVVLESIESVESFPPDIWDPRS